MTQKQFVIGLIESEIERDLAQRAAESNQRETAAVSAFEGSSEAAEGSNTEEQREGDFEDVSGGEDEDAEDGELDDEEAEDIDEDQDESEGLDDEQDESENQEMSIRM